MGRSRGFLKYLFVDSGVIYKGTKILKYYKKLAVHVSENT